MRGKRPVEITLTEQERQKLTLIASRPKSHQRDAVRARIILFCADGLNNVQVAAKTGVGRATVGQWRNRFAAGRLAGLVDAPRSGAPRRIDDAKVEEVVTETLEGRPGAKTHWSSRLMAKRAGISDHSVRRIWKAFGLKPHLTKTFKLSSDPYFVEKVRDIVGLYLDPPHGAIVFSVDEKSQCQALERTQPVLPMEPGAPERRTHDYRRHGTTSLFAALNVATGEVVANCHRRHRQQEFLKFLKLLDRSVPAVEGQEVHIVMDNYATHKTEKVQRWFLRHPRFHVHFTPTGASWINQVERWFGLITEECIRRGSFGSVRQLENAIKGYTAEHNEEPRPFNWTATPEHIFDKITGALSERTSLATH
jgi:transposase